MKTSLKFLSLFFAAGVTGVVAADFAGVALPAGIDSLDAFCAFVIALVVAIAAGDYARAARPPAWSRFAPAGLRLRPTATHPLAA